MSRPSRAAKSAATSMACGRSASTAGNSRFGMAGGRRCDCIANVEIVASAVAPNCMLHEPGKHFRETAVELSGIDGGRNRANDVGAAVRLVAAKAVWMTGPEPLQDAGPVQEIVHQGIDGNHVCTSLGPEGLWAGEEQTGQRHRQD